MTRDYAKFPDDANGDVLWRMQEDGDDLTKPREIDFSLVFPSEESALAFASHLLRNDQKVSLSTYDGNDDMPWQVQVHPIMEPTHENITGLENQLGADADVYGGQNDGWGCMAQD
jgi:Regulator of ribonuclease activity B